MLMRFLRAIALIAIATIASCPPLTASAGGPPSDPPPGYKWVYKESTHRWTLVLKSATVDEGTGGKKGKPSGKARKPACEYKGVAKPCTDKLLGVWSNTNSCYMYREVPQPPFDDPRWQGHTDGAIWVCLREQDEVGGRFLVRYIWLPDKPDTVVVDPLTVAHQAIATMQLRPPLIHTAPAVGQIGLVNMPVWLWVTKTENSWGPIVRTATVPGLSVTATARVNSIDWSMGDGTTVRCNGPGTPYNESIGIKDSPDCGHRYSHTSNKLPNCKYSVTAVARWDITWTSTLGDNGQISVTQQASTQLRIGEAVPVLVDPEGGQAVAPAGGRC